MKLDEVLFKSKDCRNILIGINKFTSLLEEYASDVRDFGNKIVFITTREVISTGLFAILHSKIKLWCHPSINPDHIIFTDENITNTSDIKKFLKNRK